MAGKSSIWSSTLIAVANVLILRLNFNSAHAFVQNYRSPRMHLTAASSVAKVGTAPTVLWYTDSPDTVAEIDASELRKRLESYGVSAEEFEETAKIQSETEKDEIRDAASVDTASEWEKLREHWSSRWEHVASVVRETLRNYARSPSSDQNSDTSFTKSHLSDDQGSEVPPSSPSSSQTAENGLQEQYANALDEGRSMSRSNLKQELEDRGIYTGFFFEKDDLVKAYATVVADRGGVKAWNANDTASTRHSKQEFDPSYRNAIMHAFDPRTLSRADIVIDITKE